MTVKTTGLGSPLHKLIQVKVGQQFPQVAGDREGSSQWFPELSCDWEDGASGVLEAERTAPPLASRGGAVMTEPWL